VATTRNQSSLRSNALAAGAQVADGELDGPGDGVRVGKVIGVGMLVADGGVGVAADGAEVEVAGTDVAVGGVGRRTGEVDGVPDPVGLLGSPGISIDAGAGRRSRRGPAISFRFATIR
jgi:hypothetical protein